MRRSLISLFLLSAFSVGAFAAELPAPGERDPRIRFVTYKKDEVVTVSVRRGAVTRIILGDDEKIVLGGTGFPSDCKKEELEWCVVADVGTNQVWVKPKDNATHNNLELKTDKRDYSFEFKVLPDSATGRSSKAAKALAKEPMFRVIVRHKLDMPNFASMPGMQPVALGGMQAALMQAAGEQNNLNERLEHAKPTPRNWKYSMQVLSGGEDIAPKLIFDDGRFTYFQFPANREVPSIYYISPAGEEGRINFHMEGDLAVVQRMGRRFVLRLGDAVVGVWNEAFDPDGIAPKDGVTVNGVTRTLR